MNTLREEIIDILKDIYYNNDQTYPFDGPNDADRIIKLFKKRIDSIKDQKDDHNYSGDDEFIDGFSLGFNHVIEKLEEEMLK